MNLHPSVATYGQRRGYNMTDRRLSQDSTISASDSAKTFEPASNLMLNLSDPEIYLGELNLFASFYNCQSLDIRQQLRSSVDSVLSHFTDNLTRFGHPSDILSSAVGSFDFPTDDHRSIANGFDIDRVIQEEFLNRFNTPLIREYFQSKINLGNIEKSMVDSANNENEIDSGSEKEDDNQEDPSWWKSNEKKELKEENEPDNEIGNGLDSILKEINDYASSLCNTDQSMEFPYLVKVYNLALNSINPMKLSAVCADVTSVGTGACFGCNNDASIFYFPLHRGVNDENNWTKFNVCSSSGVVYRVRFLEDDLGTTLLLASSDDSSCPVSLLDPISNGTIFTYRGHRWPVWALDATADGGGIFVTGSYDQTARAFLLDRKDPVRVFVGHETSVDHVRIIQNYGNHGDYPRFVSTASSDRTVRIWSMNDAIPINVLHGMKGSPTALSVRPASPNGCNEQILACATTEGKIYMWEMRSGRIYQILDNVLANDMEFSLDGRYLAIGADAGFFKLYQWAANNGGEFGSSYVELSISENLFPYQTDAKFLKVKFSQNELICLVS